MSNDVAEYNDALQLYCACLSQISCSSDSPDFARCVRSIAFEENFLAVVDEWESISKKKQYKK